MAAERTHERMTMPWVRGSILRNTNGGDKFFEPHCFVLGNLIYGVFKLMRHN